MCKDTISTANTISKLKKVNEKLMSNKNSIILFSIIY
jgi:hypothetical protein